MKKKNTEIKENNARITTKDNGDIYNYEPIIGYYVPLYETELADVPIFENPDLDQRLVDTLDEKVNNNPR